MTRYVYAAAALTRLFRDPTRIGFSFCSSFEESCFCCCSPELILLARGLDVVINTVTEIKPRATTHRVLSNWLVHGLVINCNKKRNHEGDKSHGRKFTFFCHCPLTIFQLNCSLLFNELKLWVHLVTNSMSLSGLSMSRKAVIRNFGYPPGHNFIRVVSPYPCVILRVYCIELCQRITGVHPGTLIRSDTRGWRTEPRNWKCYVN